MPVTQLGHVQTRPLDEVLPLPPEVDGLSRARVLEKLGISRTTCYRYLVCLLVKQPIGFDYIPGNRYLSVGTIEALYQFHQLVEKFQYEGAVPRINQHMERYYGI